MKDITDTLTLFGTSDGALRALALLFPGFVALAIFDLRVPGERRKWADLGVALIAYSILIDCISGAYLLLFPIPKGAVLPTIAFTIATDLVIPATIGWLAVDLRAWMSEHWLVLSAMPKAWDEFFDRIRSEPVALIVTLQDGRKVGGFWAEKPFASSYPADEDLLITVPVLINENGLFTARVLGSKGLLIRRDDILMLEAFDADSVAAASKQASAGTIVADSTSRSAAIATELPAITETQAGDERV